MSKIITVLVLIIIYESIELYKSYKANIILENVKWALSSENLRMFTFGSQDEVSMEDKYWFSDDEVDMVLEILICFKKEMVNYYFKGFKNEKTY